jgi:hypothetical protein
MSYHVSGKDLWLSKVTLSELSPYQPFSAWHDRKPLFQRKKKGFTGTKISL